MIYPSGCEEDLTIKIELNSAKEVVLCAGDTNTIYKISDINLEYDGIFDISYATNIREIYQGNINSLSSIFLENTLFGKLT